MPRAILTGGPGAGKTTLIHALAAAGIQVASESAREIIAERKLHGLSPRPSPAEFAAEILRRDSLKYRLADHRKEWTVYDRGAVEAIGGVHAITTMASSELTRVLDEHKVDKVFILPPWPEIYTTDGERDQTAEEAEHVYHLVLSWYRAVGYSPVTVPRGTIQDRVSFITHALSAV